MSGYVERTYVFPDGTIPGKFFEDATSPDWGARNLKIFGAGLSKYSGTEVVLTAESEETLDWYMQDWAEWEAKK